jgi:hypothetical protein
MDIISTNPFRILGLLANARARDVNRQTNKLLMLSEAEDTLDKDADYGFPALMGKPPRAESDVNSAKAALNLDEDRLRYALFWFWQHNDVTDEAAFDALKDKDADYATSIWQKLAERAEINERNCSALQNLSTLMIYQSLRLKRVTKTQLNNALQMKLRLLESPNANLFFNAVTDETYKADAQALEAWFVNIIWKELELHTGYSQSDFFKSVAGWRFAAHDSAVNQIADHIVESVNGKVVACEGKRKSKPAQADAYAKELTQSVKDETTTLRNVLGDNDLTCSRVCDAVAVELIACSVGWYNAQDGGDGDKFGKLFTELAELIKKNRVENIEGARLYVNEAKTLIHTIKQALATYRKPVTSKQDTALAILAMAKEMAVSNSVISRIEDNEKTLNESLVDYSVLFRHLCSRIANDALGMIAEELNGSGINAQKLQTVRTLLTELLTWELTDDCRDTLQKIDKQLNPVSGGVSSRLQKAVDEISELMKGSGATLLEKAKEPLSVIREVLGKTDSNYLRISTAVASKVLGYWVSEVNEAQESFSSAYDKQSALSTMLKTVLNANLALKDVEEMDLESDFRKRLKDNIDTLNNLQKSVIEAVGIGKSYRPRPSPRPYTPTPKKSGPCYIATMAYGDYDHPQVVALRLYRDKVLAQSPAGRLFIKTYYALSPSLVKMLEGHETINRAIRGILNQIIKQIKTK